MPKKTFQFIIIVFSLILLLGSNPVSAGRILDYCDSCHIKLIQEGDYHELHLSKRNYPCAKCHISDEGKVVLLKMGCSYCHVDPLETYHKENCRLCHKNTIHSIHVIEECILCHKKPAKPSSECNSCHGTDHHKIHFQVKNKICADCHGNIGETYANKTTSTTTLKKFEKYEKIPHGLSTLKSIISIDYWTKTLSAVNKFIVNTFWRSGNETSAF